MTSPNINYCKKHYYLIAPKTSSDLAVVTNCVQIRFECNRPASACGLNGGFSSGIVQNYVFNSWEMLAKLLGLSSNSASQSSNTHTGDVWLCQITVKSEDELLLYG